MSLQVSVIEELVSSAMCLVKLSVNAQGMYSPIFLNPPPPSSFGPFSLAAVVLGIWVGLGIYWLWLWLALPRALGMPARVALVVLLFFSVLSFHLFWARCRWVSEK